MCLSTAEIQAVLRDLTPRLEGGRIERIDQPDGHRLILRVRRGGSRCWLQLVAHPRFSRLHLLTRRPKGGAPAGGFCNVLRQHVTGSPIESIRQVPNDRVVIFSLVRRDALLRPHPVRLIAELTGAGSNIILVGEQDRVLGAMFAENSPRRRVLPGAPYVPLPAPAALPARAQENRFSAVQPGSPDELALSRAIQDAYTRIEAQAALDARRGQLNSLVRGRLKALRARARNIERDLADARDAECLRREGELLKIALPGLEKGQPRVVVQDVFEPDAPEVTITLDPNLSPQQNVERRFQRYKKLKAGLEGMAARLEKTRGERARLDALARRVEAAGDGAALEVLETEARALGLAQAEGRPPSKPPAASGPRRFVSADKLEILVARNRRQNHQLTFSIARGSDCWMHLLGREGPHVVIRKPKDRDVPLETLLDAGHLAVYFSKMRGADFAELVYTQRKHVHPVKGAGPGTVRYANVSRLAVRFDEGRIRRLLQRT